MENENTVRKQFFGATFREAAPLTKELRAITEYNTRIEKDRWSRFSAGMIFITAILYYLVH